MPKYKIKTTRTTVYVYIVEAKDEDDVYNQFSDTNPSHEPVEELEGDEEFDIMYEPELVED